MVVAHKIIIRNASLKWQSVDLHITGNRISRIVPHLQDALSCPETNDNRYIDTQGMILFQKVCLKQSAIGVMMQS